jgi:hypothetical protein
MGGINEKVSLRYRGVVGRLRPIQRTITSDAGAGRANPRHLLPDADGVVAPGGRSATLYYYGYYGDGSAHNSARTSTGSTDAGACDCITAD